MSLQDDREIERRRKSEDGEETEPHQPQSRRRRSGGGEMGDALRSAYQRMMDEDIPPEMLDLLGKLG